LRRAFLIDMPHDDRVLAPHGYYWRPWSLLPIRFDRRLRSNVPEHWHTAGPRTSKLDRQWPRRAMTPVHAALNFAYAIVEAEAVLAAYAVGFDPSIGLMHTDVRYRGSLAIDLMEPIRPVADEFVLDLLEERELCRGDVVETRRGVCRLGPALVKQVVQVAPALRVGVGPIAERLADRLLGRAPTPLTRRRHRTAGCEARH